MDWNVKTLGQQLQLLPAATFFFKKMTPQELIHKQGMEKES